MPKNARNAASSARAAEALAKGGTAVGFAAAAGFKFGASQLRPASTWSESSGDNLTGDASSIAVSSQLDSDLVQHLRHLTKKDPTTKNKALQALKALLRDKSEAQLGLFAAPWIGHYKRLIMDTSRLVRLEGNELLAMVVGRLGKGIAPTLKTLMGPWWLAQFDPHPDAANAAKTAFQAAFTGPKQWEALMYCNQEVLQYLADCLTSTPQVLGDPRKDTPEELQERYERVVSQALLATAQLLQMAVQAAVTAVQDEAGKTTAASKQAQLVARKVSLMLAQPGFFKKFMTSKNALVRRSTYTFIQTLASHKPQLLATAAQSASSYNVVNADAASAQVSSSSGAASASTALAVKDGDIQTEEEDADNIKPPPFADVSNSVLGSFGDAEPSNHAAMLGMVLAFTRALPDAWQAANLHKAVLPRLYSLLRHACYGSAPSTMPAMLPLLSLMPSSVLWASPTVPAAVLSALWAGLARAGGVAAENAIVGAYGECLVWLLNSAEKQGSKEEVHVYLHAILEETVGKVLLSSAIKRAGAPGKNNPAGTVLQKCLAAQAAAGSGDAEREGRPALAVAGHVLGMQLVDMMSSGLRDERSEEPGKRKKTQVSAKQDAGVEDRIAVDPGGVPEREQPGQNGAAGSSAVELSREEVMSRVADLLQHLAESVIASRAFATQLLAHLLPPLLHEVYSPKPSPAAVQLLAVLVNLFGIDAINRACKAEPAASSQSNQLELSSCLNDATSPENTEEGRSLDKGAAPSGNEPLKLDLHKLAACLTKGDIEVGAAGAATAQLLAAVLQQASSPVTAWHEFVTDLTGVDTRAGVHTAPAGSDDTTSTADDGYSAAGSEITGVEAESQLSGQGRPTLSFSDESSNSHVTVVGPQWRRLKVLELVLNEVGCAQQRYADTREAVTQNTASSSAPHLESIGNLAVILCRRDVLTADSAAPSLLSVLMLGGRAKVRPPSLSRSETAPPSPGVVGVELISHSVMEHVLSQLGSYLAVAVASTCTNPQDSAEQLQTWTAAQSSLTALSASLSDASSHLWRVHAKRCSSIIASVFRLSWGAAGEFSSEVRAVQAVGGPERIEVHRAVRETAKLVWQQGALLRTARKFWSESDFTELLQQLAGLITSQFSSSSSLSSTRSWAQRAHHLLNSCSSTESIAQQLLDTFLQVVERTARWASAAPAGMTPSAASVQNETSSHPAVPSAFAATFAAELAMATGMEWVLNVPSASRQADTTNLSGDVHRAEESVAFTPRSWLAVELLCYCNYVGGQGSTWGPCEEAIISHLALCAQQSAEQPAAAHVHDVLHMLFEGGMSKGPEAPHTGALSIVLTGLVQDVNRGENVDRLLLDFFKGHCAMPDSLRKLQINDASSPLHVLQAVLQVLAPVLRSTDHVTHVGTSSSTAAEESGLADLAVASCKVCTVDCFGGTEVGSEAEGVAINTWLRMVELVFACFPLPKQLQQGQQLPVGDKTGVIGLAVGPSEAEALLELTRHQATRVAGWATASRVAGSSTSSGAADASLPGRSPELDAALADLALRSLLYCHADFRNSDWHWVMLGVSGRLDSALRTVAADVRALATSVVQAGRAILGARNSGDASDAMPAATVVQVLRKLTQRGVVMSHPAMRSLQEDVTELVEGERVRVASVTAVWTMQVMLTLEGGLKRAYGLPSGWVGFMKSSGSAVMKLLIFGGFIQVLSLAAGEGVSTLMDEWWGEQTAAALWRAVAASAQLLCKSGEDAVAAALLSAEEEVSISGVDFVEGQLGLLLDQEHTPELREAAWQLLLHPAVLPGLTFAESLKEEDMPEYESDLPAYLALLGVRAAMVMELCSEGISQTKLQSFALLLAHVQTLEKGSTAQRLICQALQDAHDMLSDIFNIVAPLLPLQAAASSKNRRSSSNLAGLGAGNSPAPVPGGASSGTADSASSTGEEEVNRRLQLALPVPTGSWNMRSCLAGMVLTGPAHNRQLVEATYRGALRALPASIRTWYSDLRDRALVAQLEAYTAMFESPALLAAEFASISSQSAAFSKDKFTVKANASTREVLASMEIEDGATLEMVVKLPACTPLKAAEVECRKQLGVSESRLRKWLLSISVFLRSGNAGVCDAVLLWKKSLDREFQGLEPCLICYSVIHPANQALPRLQCKTCKVRFHPACLYKWFKSSGKSLCPHCQSPW